ncbi:group 1 glycosyl transferase [Salinisphaera sp. PC39]
MAALTRDARLRPVYWERGSGWHADHHDPRTVLMLDSIDHALANSDAGARMLRYHGFRGHVGICRNGLHPEMFQHEVAPKHLPRDRPLTLAVVARLVPYKGVALALHTLRMLVRQGLEVRLRIAGTGPDRPMLAALSRKLEIEERVEFYGVVNDMPRFYAEVDCLLHPALCEPSSNAVAEAIHFGCPVLAANVDGIPEVMHPDCGAVMEPTLSERDYAELGVAATGQPKAVYFPGRDEIARPRALDPTSLTSAVESLVAEDKRYERVSEQCLDWSRRHYDPVARYRDLFGHLLQMSAGDAS